MIRYAIFDMDGTLLDSLKLWDTVGSDYLAYFGIPAPADLLEIVREMSIAQSSRYFHDVLGVPRTVEQIIWGINQVPAEKYRHTVPLKPGVREFLQVLHQQGTKLCVATAVDHDVAVSALTRLEILPLFEFVLTSDQVGSGKDDPGIYLEAARRLGGTPAETMVFEDSPYCIRTVHRAGFQVTAVYDKVSAHSEEELLEMQRLSDFYLPDYSPASVRPLLEGKPSYSI